MRITRKQLRQIIKEEYGMGRGANEDMMSLLSYLQGAVDRAEYMSVAKRADAAYSQGAQGTEANDLAAMLEEIWVAAGFDPSEIFK